MENPNQTVQSPQYFFFGAAPQTIYTNPENTCQMIHIGPNMYQIKNFEKLQPIATYKL